MTAPLWAGSRPDGAAPASTTPVALVHDWLTGMRGGERVLEALLDLYPDAPLYTLLHVPGSVSERIEARPIHSSFVQRLPSAERLYRWYLPLYPWAVEGLDVGDHALVISTSHCVAKSVLTHPRALHVCYCHTPMRYAWDQFDTYFSPQRTGPLRYLAISAAIAWLRRWDRATADRVDVFVANSAWVAGRIDRYYGRTAAVVPPPVDTDWFTPASPDPGESHEPRAARQATPTGAGAKPYHLVVSALSPYKRLEVAVEAFNRMRRRLVVVGDGPERRRLEALAGPTVEFRGRVDAATLRDLYRGCRATLLCGIEDAGIAPLEGMACGRPAVVLERGGAIEAIVEGVTGTTFATCSPEALVAAIDRVERTGFDPARIRAHAERYSIPNFRRRFADIIASRLRRR